VRPGVKGSGVAVDPERVRQARLDAGLSLGEVAGKEVSRTFIHQIEHGQARPSTTVLNLIAQRTGKPLKYFTRRSTASVSGHDLSLELSGVATRVRRFMAVNRLSSTERDALKLVEVSLRQGATLARGIRTEPRR
jgi:transcriptional regulator with XRE-family HTH domain